MFTADWLGQAVHAAVQVISFGVWIAGCGLALRRCLAAGAGFTAAGFGLPALVEVTSTVFYVAFVFQMRAGPVAAFPVTVALLLGGLGGVGKIAGAALVVAGLARTSRGAARSVWTDGFDR